VISSFKCAQRLVTIALCLVTFTVAHTVVATEITKEEFCAEGTWKLVDGTSSGTMTKLAQIADLLGDAETYIGKEFEVISHLTIFQIETLFQKGYVGVNAHCSFWHEQPSWNKVEVRQNMPVWFIRADFSPAAYIALGKLTKEIEPGYSHRFMKFQATLETDIYGIPYLRATSLQEYSPSS